MKCLICEKSYNEEDITVYKFKPICRSCITFFKNTIIFYGNGKAWVKRETSESDDSDYKSDNVDYIPKNT